MKLTSASLPRTILFRVDHQRDSLMRLARIRGTLAATRSFLSRNFLRDKITERSPLGEHLSIPSFEYTLQDLFSSLGKGIFRLKRIALLWKTKKFSFDFVIRGLSVYFTKNTDRGTLWKTKEELSEIVARHTPYDERAQIAEGWRRRTTRTSLDQVEGFRR